MLKTLTQPLTLALLVQICAVAVCWIRLRRRRPIGSLTWPLAAISVAAVVLAVLSTLVAGALLQDSLNLGPAPENFTPDYVVVLSGGSEEGFSPDLDVLSSETTKRVLFGIRYWKSHPSARMIMTGAGEGRNPGRMTELMVEVARCRGVPTASIIREPSAVNTREHVLRLRGLPGFTPTTRLAIVTSAWHERRAMTEFRRYFLFVVPVSVQSPMHSHPKTLIPDAWGLAKSSESIQEWIGIVWYRIRALFDVTRR